VTLRYRNVGNTPIKTFGASHQLALNGIDIGTATSDRRVVIPRLGTTTEELEFHISNFGVLSRIQNIIASGNLNYDIESEVFLSDGWFGNSITTSRSGSLNDFLPLGGAQSSGGSGRRPNYGGDRYPNRYDARTNRPANRQPPIRQPADQDQQPDCARPDYYDREPETDSYGRDSYQPAPTNGGNSGRRVPEPYQPEPGSPYGGDRSFDRGNQFDRGDSYQRDNFDRNSYDRY
jgi:hypothetical protein